jgi:hypothetical protein
MRFIFFAMNAVDHAAQFNTKVESHSPITLASWRLRFEASIDLVGVASFTTVFFAAAGPLLVAITT